MIHEKWGQDTVGIPQGLHTQNLPEMSIIAQTSPWKALHSWKAIQ